MARPLYIVLCMCACLHARRMEEVRASEVRATLEDLMYVSILEKFLLLGVDMLPRMDGEKEA